MILSDTLLFFVFKLRENEEKGGWVERVDVRESDLVWASAGRSLATPPLYLDDGDQQGSAKGDTLDDDTTRATAEAL